MLADVDLQWVSLVLECGAVEGHDVGRDGGKFWVIGQIVLLGGESQTLLYGVEWRSSFHAMASAHCGITPSVWCFRLACFQAFSM